MTLADGQAAIYRGSHLDMLGMLLRVEGTTWPYSDRYTVTYWDDGEREAVLHRVRESSLRPVDPDQVVAMNCDRHGFWHVPADSQDEGCPSCEAGLCDHSSPLARCLACRPATPS
jgi:hypothetical protein